MEGGRVEYRDERRIRRSRQRREEPFVEPSEEVDRLPLRNPERPGVPVVQAREPRPAKERLDEEHGECDSDGGDDWHTSASERRKGGSWTAEPAATDETRRDEHRSSQKDEPARERDADHEQERPDDTDRGDAREIGEATEPGELEPGAPATGQPEHRSAADEDEEIEGNKPGDRADRHVSTLRIEMPSPFVQTSVASSP